MGRLWFLIPLILVLAHISLTQGFNRARYRQFQGPFLKGWWDAGHYRTIAATGYYYKIQPDGAIKTNITWFPGYPLLLRAAFRLTGRASLAVLILAYGLFTLNAYLMFFYMRRQWRLNAAVITTAAFCFFPTSFYFQLGFPYNLVITLMLVYLFAEHWTSRPLTAAGVKFTAAFWMALSYPTAWIFDIVPLTSLALNEIKRGTALIRRPEEYRRTAGKALLCIAPFALGLLTVSLFYYVTFGDFFLINSLQKTQFGRSWANPFGVILREFMSVRNIWTGRNTLVVIVFATAMGIFYSSSLPFGFLLFTLCGLLFSPFTGSMEAVYRHYVLLFPAYMTIGLSRRPVFIKVLFLIAVFLAGLKFYFAPFLNHDLV